MKGIDLIMREEALCYDNSGLAAIAVKGRNTFISPHQYQTTPALCTCAKKIDLNITTPPALKGLDLITRDKIPRY